jgi:hypothetical protein
MFKKLLPFALLALIVGTLITGGSTDNTFQAMKSAVLQEKSYYAYFIQHQLSRGEIKADSSKLKR